MKRLLALLIAVVLAVSAVVAAGGMKNGRRTDGLYYAATDIHPDAQLMKINGDTVSAEEYLYWLAYDCEYLTSFKGEVDWDSQVSDGMTYSQYAKADALEAVKLYTVVRQWAKDGDITLDETDQAQLEAQRQEYVTYYGGEDAYARQVQLLGISADAFEDINSVYYLYNKVLQQFCTSDSTLYPGDAPLQAFAEENAYLTVKLLYISTEGLENQDAIDMKEETARQYAEKLQSAEDVDGVYAQLADELGLEYPDNGLTLSGNDDSLDASVTAAAAALDEGQISDVITGENGFYIAIRMPLDQKAVAADYFTVQLQAARDSAEVKFHDKLYDSIDVADFYTRLLQQRSALQAQFDAAGDNTTIPENSIANHAETDTVLPKE